MIYGTALPCCKILSKNKPHNLITLFLQKTKRNQKIDFCNLNIFAFGIPHPESRCFNTLIMKLSWNIWLRLLNEWISVFDHLCFKK